MRYSSETYTNIHKHTHHKTTQTHISSTIAPFHNSITFTTLMKWKIDQIKIKSIVHISPLLLRIINM